MTRSPAAETRAPRDLVADLLDDLESTGRDTAPDLIMITGNLAERATSAEYETAHQFLTALRDALGIENQQIVLVPGSRDVNRGKCEAYFLQCEADDTRPVPPFWEKWQPFSTVMLRRFHGTELPKDQPWALTEHPNQRVVVAGFNTTMAITHLPGEQAGSLGDAQIDWFADELSARGRRDWFRIGVMHHRPEGEDAITDAGRFADVAGPYLDLVLHGQPGGPAVSLPGAAVPVLGSDGPWQLIEVRADQVRVLPDGEPIRLPSRSARVPKPRPRRPEPPAALRLFTEQVAEVCRLRNKGADVVPGPGQSRGRVAYLRVSPARNRSDRGPAEQHPIGVCADRPAREDVDWFAGVLAHFHTGGSESPAEMVHAGEAADPELRDWAQSRGIDLVTFSDYQVGPALRSFAENQAAELDNDTIYRSDLYVPQRFNEFLPPSATPTGVTPATDLLTWLRDWVAAPRGRLVVVLGTFGHGKTFLLKELARRLTRDAARTIPILIDLRGFEKAYSLDELVTVQLYRHGHRQVDLDVFRYLRREGRIILLFDGFDELATRVSYDRATNHLDTIVQAAEQHAKVVVTSRDQHFLTDADVLTALGTQLGTDRQVVRIGNFDDEQIIAFLTNQLRDEHDARTRFELLRGIKELLPLSRNPRMLGFITELGEDQLTPAGHPINAALLYRQVLEKWLSYEAVRLKRLGPDAPDKKVLMKAVTHLALRLWDQPDESLSLEDLGDAAVALSQLTTPDVGVPSVLEPQESAHVLGSSTLLVRSGDQRFTFVHDSVREWLIANHLATQPPGGIAADGLIGHKWQPLMIEFLCGLAGDDVMRAWAEGVLAAQPTSGVVRNNADKVLRFLGVDSSKSLNMSGVDWRGEDHSSQYLVGADLSDADLTDVNLIGANLTDATMTGANLTGARLDRAVLRGTDLSGAVLSGAWLLGADLTGSVLTGVNLRRAALVAVAGVGEDELRTADTLGAALPGGAPEIQVASAAVIQAVAVVSGVKLLAGAGADGSIRIWDAFSGRPLRVLAGHTGPLFAIAFTTDGRYLASAGDDETVRVWETTTGRPVHLLTGHSGRIRALAFSPDGKHLASAGDDEDIRIWDTDSGRRIRVMRTGGGRIRALAYQPSGGHLASGGRGGPCLGHHHGPARAHPHRAHRNRVRGGVRPRRHPDSQRQRRPAGTRLERRRRHRRAPADRAHPVHPRDRVPPGRPPVGQRRRRGRHPCLGQPGRHRATAADRARRPGPHPRLLPGRGASGQRGLRSYGPDLGHRRPPAGTHAARRWRGFAGALFLAPARQPVAGGRLRGRRGASLDPGCRSAAAGAARARARRRPGHRHRHHGERQPARHRGWRRRHPRPQSGDRHVRAAHDRPPRRRERDRLRPVRPLSGQRGSRRHGPAVGRHRCRGPAHLRRGAQLAQRARVPGCRVHPGRGGGGRRRHRRDRAHLGSARP
jgi:hypothetical protein